MHAHTHHHAPSGMDPRIALAGSLVLNGAFLLVEAGVGWWSGSLALLSDAGHMLSDVAALVLALGAAVVARRPVDAARTFGWARIEVLGGFVNGLTQLLVCGWILVEAVERLQGPAPAVPGLPVLVVAVVGLLINLGSVGLLIRSDRDNLNIRGALLHMAADALGSVGAVVAALFLLADIPVADVVISVLLSLLILHGTVGLLKDAGRVLLQLPPSGLDVAEVRAALLGVAGVAGVHDLHVWTLDGRTAVLTAHLVVPEAPRRDEIRADAAHVLAHRFRIGHATLQVEVGSGPDSVPCGQPPCDVEGDTPEPVHRDDGHGHEHGHAHEHGHGHEHGR